MADDACHSRLEILLYIVGNGPNSTLAVENLQLLCRRHTNDDRPFELVDLARNSARALADEVFFTPMLVIRQGDDEQRFIGNLSRDSAVVRALALGYAGDE